tara:strand:- start:92 stop:325 length:234 start_codon:yes stop_codon:yes gene_type:complete
MDEGSKKKLNQLFDDYLELLDNRTSINAQVTELIDEAATLTNLKKTLIRKAFGYLKKKQEDGIDELDDIIMITEELG